MPLRTLRGLEGCLLPAFPLLAVLLIYQQDLLYCRPPGLLSLGKNLPARHQTLGHQSSILRLKNQVSPFGPRDTGGIRIQNMYNTENLNSTLRPPYASCVVEELAGRSGKDTLA